MKSLDESSVQNTIYNFIGLLYCTFYNNIKKLLHRITKNAVFDACILGLHTVSFCSMFCSFRCFFDDLLVKIRVHCNPHCHILWYLCETIDVFRQKVVKQFLLTGLGIKLLTIDLIERFCQELRVMKKKSKGKTYRYHNRFCHKSAQFPKVRKLVIFEQPIWRYVEIDISSFLCGLSFVNKQNICVYFIQQVFLQIQSKRFRDLLLP